MSGRKLFIILVIGGVVTMLVLFPEIWEPVVNSFMGTGKEGTSATAPAETTRSTPIKVFRARGDEQYYHRRECPELVGRSAVVMTLGTAKALCKPCPVCKPPE